MTGPRELPLGVQGAAERAGMPHKTFASHRRRGQAPEPDGWIDGRTPVWWGSTIDRWVRERSQTTDTTKAPPAH